jgi:MFS family permease
MKTLLDDPLSTTYPGRRRLMVVAIVLGLGGYVTGSLLRWPVLTLLALLTAVAAWALLRRAIGTVADMPDDQLDERQVGVRDRAYLSSYRVIGGLIGLLVAATVLWDAFDIDQVDTVLVQTVGGAVLFLMIALPSCIVGWTERVA